MTIATKTSELTTAMALAIFRIPPSVVALMISPRWDWNLACRHLTLKERAYRKQERIQDYWPR